MPLEEGQTSEFEKEDVTNSEKTLKKYTKACDSKEQKQSTKQKQLTKRKLLLPWWTRIIGHTFCNLSILAAAAFIVFMGIQFGEDKVKRWLASLFISLITSIVLCQPIQVKWFYYLILTKFIK